MHKIFNNIDFKKRRENLVKNIQGQNPDLKNGIILIFANFEIGTAKFKQESTFYYFTGIQEPGSVLLINLEDNSSSLFVPNSGVRMHWVANCINPEICKAQDIGLDFLNYLGDKLVGYELKPFFLESDYSKLLEIINSTIKNNGKIFTTNPNNQYEYFQQRFILDRISKFIPEFKNNLIDISNIIAKLRRKKSPKEIEALYKAVDITIMGQEAAIQTIAPDKFENEIQAAIEYVFKISNADIAFSSIVGGGKNSTVLHYTANSQKLEKNNLVVVDIGAEFEHYCGDITRTYPISGKFSNRQKEIYDIVLETQEYIESIARPGLYLSNKDYPDLSLNHLAREFLKEKNYEQYFLHGIGHYLGLDVHDVGDSSEQLEIGDVITIEPGIYISQENIGVRIEDNYWLVEDGVVCLSEHLPKSSKEIENLLSK